MTSIQDKIQESVNYINSKLGDLKPKTGLILGSGLGVIGDEIQNPTIIPYNDIPGFLKSTVEGHKGQLIIGNLEGKTVLAMQGRFHFYEGYSIQEITLPVRVMKLLGIENLIITNAAGAVNKDFNPGDLMLISDHINFGFDNPLIGKNLDNFGPRFPDTSESYNKTLQDIATNSAKNLGVELKQGVYQFSSGPTYETPAETRVARSMGADVVGMSTVPEVLVAVHSGLKVLGISCVTNMAAGILDQPLDHQEVIETSALAREKFVSLIKKIISHI